MKMHQARCADCSCFLGRKGIRYEAMGPKVIRSVLFRTLAHAAAEAGWVHKSPYWWCGPCWTKTGRTK